MRAFAGATGLRPHRWPATGTSGCGPVGTASPVIQGSVALGFERVGRAFERSFAERGKHWAAVAAYVEGRAVVELTGTAAGLAGSAPWPQDARPPRSLQPWRTALAAAVALSQGLLSLDRTVAEHWPRFARHGKGGITIRQVLAHRSGILLRTRLEARTPGGSVAGALEEARPLWEPGSRQAYDDLMASGIISALLARTDPHRRSLEEFSAQEVAGPLGLHLPLANDAGVIDRGAEVSGVAKALGEMATEGDRLGISRDVFAEVVARPAPPSMGWGDVVLGADLRCSMGFVKPSPAFPFGSGDRAFGLGGAGGVFAFADPDLGLGFCYAADRAGLALPGDARERSLRDAVLRCLGAQQLHNHVKAATEGGTGAGGE